MAAKNSRKIYLQNSIYHIYNRGVEKRLIFVEEQDYGVFLSYIKEYLSFKDVQQLRQQLADPNTGYKEKDKILKKLKLNNFYGEITLLAYCLMPNHFHLLLKQTSPQSIDKLMNSLGVRYAMYFNRKYNRVGKLFQDVYKAVSVESDEQLLHLTRYIHQNPCPLNNARKSITPRTPDQVLQAYLRQPSSLLEYLGLRKTEWINSEIVLAFFAESKPSLNYQTFVLNHEYTNGLEKLTIEL